jgi:hypothetical protein
VSDNPKATVQDNKNVSSRDTVPEPGDAHIRNPHIRLVLKEIGDGPDEKKVDFSSISFNTFAAHGKN